MVVSAAGGGSPQPPVADFDGDDDTDISVYRPSEHRWYLKDGVPAFTDWGIDDDLLVPGDYDGDGGDDFAVCAPPRASGT